MKNNLTARARAWAIVSAVFCLLGLVTGCGTARTVPTPVEQHFYNITTNIFPVVSNHIEVLTITNAGGIVETSNRVTWATNFEVAYTYTANTNAAQLAQSVQAIGNLFGPYGALAGSGIAGLFALWGAIRSRHAAKMTTASTVLSQGIEILLEIVKTTPQGQQLSDKLKLELSKNQNAAGVLAEIAGIVQTQVDNTEAKKLAEAILATLPKTP